MAVFNDDYSESTDVFQEKFGKLVSLIESSHSMTVFTGAGVSTLSGIPDFRGDHGVYTDPWHGMAVEDIISMSFFRRRPDVFYRWAKDVWYRLEDYEPNIVHDALALLERKGYLDCVFTQNIDMLHRKAGSTVLEVHGSPEFHHCTRCGRRYGYDEIAPLVRSDELPLCSCGGVIKPDIIFYGENLDSHILDEAERRFSQTDMCLVLGSSLTVQPAAFFPVIAKYNGAEIVIVNAQATPQDRNATLCFSDLRQTMQALFDYLLNK